MSTSSRKLSIKVERYGSSSDDDTETEELPAPYTDGSKEFTHNQFVERFRILAKKVFCIEESDYLDTTDLCAILVENINKNVLKIDGTIVERPQHTTTNNHDNDSLLTTIGNPDEIQMTQNTVIIPLYTLNRLEEQRFQSVSNTAVVARNFLRQQKLQREFGRASYHEKNEAAIVVQCFWRVVKAKRERERMAKLQWMRLKQELASCRKILQDHSRKLKEKETETFLLQEKVDYLEVVNEKLSILAETLTVSRETAATDDTTHMDDNDISSLPANAAGDSTVVSTSSYWKSNSPFAICFNRRYNRE